ncbi:MAG TPA: LA2681 family HEPN domain-containing protein [archaeon]|nr:LA2681 family HEPN domain-containing protein [archaeon]
MDTKYLNKLNKLIKQTIELKNKGKYQETLRIDEKLKKFKPHPIISLLRSCILIDAGDYLKDEEIVKEGINLLKEDIEELVKDYKYAQKTFYYLGNGYYSLYNFKRQKEPTIGCLKETELNKAKEFFKKATKLKIKDNFLGSQIFTNLANCYDSLGRVFDALECYDEAIKLKPDHGMALANKGIALDYLASIQGIHKSCILLEAYFLLKKAFEYGVYPESKPGFLTYSERIENFFKGSNLLEKSPEYPKYEIKRSSKFEKFHIEFCLKNKLYLNILNYLPLRKESVGDPVFIEKMIVQTDKIKGEKYLKDDPFLCLSRYLNQIKEDYISARFLLILSRYKGINLGFIYKKLRLINTLDYSEHNIYIQLLKTSFKNLFDILDKISIFLNDYLNLGINKRELYFLGFWYSDKKQRNVRKNLLELKNYSLNALFDIANDLDYGEYNNLKLVRNALTHRFIYIEPLDDSEENEERMREDTLLKQTLQLAKLVRNAIIYMLSFVYIEECKKEKNISGTFIPQVFLDDIICDY